MTQCIIHKIRFSESFTSLILECFAKLVSLQSNIHTFYEYAVAPHAGAWIETNLNPSSRTRTKSHPTRVRGLKLNSNSQPIAKQVSHPTRVRGLKLC